MKKAFLSLGVLLMMFSLVSCGNDSSTSGTTTDDSGDTDTGGTTDDDDGDDDDDTKPGDGGGSGSGGSGASSTATISYGTITDTSAAVIINNETYTYKANLVVSGTETTIDNQTFNNSTSDSNVILVCNGGTLNINDCILNKTGDGSAYTSDDYNFYGLNSAIICIGEDSTININNMTINSDAEGANAIFSFGGANINIDDIDITTKENSSRGLYSTYKGIITANDINIVTNGAHCAPLATDRGGGYVYVNSGTNYVEAHGDGSPCIYSTGDIEATNLTGYSEEAQTMVIEGKNIITVSNSTLTSDSESNDGIMLYQSMSGDASDDVASQTYSTLTISDSTINYKGSGDYGLYLITNTSSIVNSTNVTYVSSDEDFIWCGAVRWGTDGSNGGDLTFNSYNETLTNKISTNTDDSSITLNLKDNSTFTGTSSGNVDIN
ncbi:MAG: hypothetical protein WCR97_03410 [Bacilli bacterium]